MRIFLSSALAMSLLGAALLAQLLFFDATDTTQRLTEPTAVAGQHATVFRSPRDQRQIRSFEAFVALTALKAGPKQAWHPPETQ